MSSYVYRPNMDEDIKNIIKSCKDCALTAKASPIKYRPWPKMDQPWSWIHIDFAGLPNRFYYLIVVDRFSKWSEVLRCRNPTTEVTINFLHKLFAKFGVVNCLISNNGTQFTSGNFKDFCETFQINHISIALGHTEKSPEES